MINCIQIERIILPPLFIFDSLTLSAKFVSTSVNLATLKFKTHEYLR